MAAHNEGKHLLYRNGIRNTLRVTNCQKILSMLSYQPTPVIQVNDPVLEQAGIQLFIKREDLNHPFVSGNKWWKLKYNLEEARRLGKKTLLTFGGAYSNHIYATAAAAKECGFESIGIIRGEETLPLNSTLAFAKACGMQLHYVSREAYRLKDEPSFKLKLHEAYGDFHLIPEGGSNALAVRGVKEFAEALSEKEFDHVCVPAGTGGTLAGLVAGFNGKQNIVGFSVLKGGEFLHDAVRALLTRSSCIDFQNWRIETAYHHGGYGKVTKDLTAFIAAFEKKHAISLDAVYTGKMMFGIFDMIKKGMFRHGSTISVIHTGGLRTRNQITPDLNC